MMNSQRFALARKRRGMKKRELAIRLGITERSVSAYESGDQAPEAATLRKIVEVLRFPEAFFFGDDPEIPTPDVASFRSLSKMTSGQRDCALGAGAVALLLNQWIESRFELPNADLPDLGRERSTSTVTTTIATATEVDDYAAPDAAQDPEAAAEMLRAAWALGEQPIKNMVALLESKGVRVFSLAIDAKEVDAFSMWSGGRPFIFLNTLKSAEHCRFDAAHELGHLVLHRHAQPQGPDLEREANSFASSFLMPRRGVLAVAPRMPSLANLIRHKAYWAVSVAALNYRLHAIGLTSDWTYRTLCIHIAQEGYRTSEPAGRPREKSAILDIVFGRLREEGISKAEVARELSIPVEEIEALTFGLIINPLEPDLSDKSLVRRVPRGQLRLVKG